jgi:hypothetical protein
MYRSIQTKSISRRTQAPLAFALALALGQSAAPARAGVLMDHADPIGPIAASRFNTGLKMGEQKAVLARQFARRNPPLPPTAHRPAGTVVVANCDDSGAGSLREALATAASGDVIDLTALTCSTISLSSGQLTVAVDDLAVRGPGTEQLVIDGNSDSRILAHTGYGLLDIDGVSLRNGNYAYTGPVLYSGLAAGGCLLSTGNVTLTNSKIENCSAAGTSVSGAAIDAHGRLIMTDSTVSGVSATATSNEISATIYGGAVYAAASYLTHATISNATVSASATTAFGGAFGGGIFSLYGIVLTDSRISGVSVDVSAAKIAYAKGGGIGTPRTVVMSGSTVADNSVRGTPGVGASGAYTYISAIGGGGVYIASIPRGVPPASSITGSTISGNSATCSADIGQYTVGGGGGVATWSPARLAIVNSTISGNSAATMGGGLYSRHFGAFGLSNSTVTDNTAPDGSGVADQGEEWPYDFSTLSSLVAGNHATGAQTFEITTLHTIGGANNLIASANVALPPGTLSGDPMLAPLADNGGPTRTHALLPGSPAIDQGSNPDNLASDQRGATFLRVFGNSTDIGSYELQPLPERIFANGFD